ncbi:MAG: putative quinol monooxygenase [Acidimicrobiia bacterium]
MTHPALVISGEIRIDPDDFDAAMALVDPFVAETRSEAGCLEYGFWIDPHDRGRIRVYEEWATEAENDAHAQAPHYLEFLTQMAAIDVRSVELFRFEVSSKALI